MENFMIKKFIHWYVINNQNKNSNYLKNNFKNDVLLFEEKLEEISNEFYSNYLINPFEIDVDNSNEIELKINIIKSKLAIKAKGFVQYNKKFGNGIPNALLSKNNYLRFLTELLILKEEKIEFSNFFLRKEFINYLINEESFTVGSAKSYASYVSSAIKNTLNDNLKIDFFGKIEEHFINSNNSDEIEDLLNLCISIIHKKTINENKSKYKSGLSEYKSFLISLKFDIDLCSIYTSSEVFSKLNLIEKTECIDLKINLGENNSDDLGLVIREITDENEFIDFEIDKVSLISNFKMRMITQDRLYGDVYFPIRFLKKIFYQKNENKVFFDKFILNQIEEIKIFTSNSGEFILLKNIEGISIKKDKVYVETLENKHRLVYTELAIENQYDILSVPTLRKIAIDHVVPMKSLLLDFKDKLNGLYNLTELLKSKGITKSGKESIKQLAKIGNEIIDSDLLLDDEINLIKEDFTFLKDKLELQLMCAKSNLEKNNR
ncbi:hypothetical protein G6N05_01265 [Flavobacterium sp. F372]|uniref:Lantibiotic dehydratase N-terminal domain-containing protein n=1 Tax=Flavobacterium bernardetii TaxID=2813823 RepID=A0ABR7IUQ6_9FLAO|nr:hypothetical protein [Flavobacterium bernardetii]MBC5833505.1 hypothetical protein [Flavobacterium bernardetii]NHF68737.1 hypothetical protein [Flavobacterium bernardetii]